MFCPNCKAEFVEGIIVCSDCNLLLVEELPEEDETGNDAPGFVKILATFNSADLVVIKSLLDSAGLEYHIEGENFHYIGHPLVQSVKLFVREDQVETAKELLSAIDLRGWAIAPINESGADDEPEPESPNDSVSR